MAVCPHARCSGLRGEDVAAPAAQCQISRASAPHLGRPPISPALIRRSPARAEACCGFMAEMTSVGSAYLSALSCSWWFARGCRPTSRWVPMIYKECAW